MKQEELVKTNKLLSQLEKIVEVMNKEGKTVFQLKGDIAEKSEEIERKRKETGRFILGTNILDESLVSESEILEKYKEQSVCEKGFAFLKDPLFFADSFFVEKPERIETILFLMSLSFLRWIFQCFQGIHLLILNGVEQVVNLTDERSFILEFLPASCHKYYL